MNTKKENKTEVKPNREIIDDNNANTMSRYTKERAARDAYRIYRTVFAGDFATLGRPESSVAGYPFGSVMPYIIDHTGNPVIFTSDLAEHTKNILDNGKASLMMRQVERQHQIETGWRLTCVSDVVKVSGEDKARVEEAYYRHYPHSESYNSAHKFDFFRLKIVAARVIMGFGKISWLEVKDLVVPSPFSRDQENEALEHMNQDHSAAIRHYLSKFDVIIKEKQTPPRMVGVNQFGATIEYHHHLYFVAFKEVAATMTRVREQLVALAKQ